MPSPGTVEKAPTTGGPSCHPGKKQETTWSPTANSVAPSPTVSTTPAPSDIGMRPSAVGIIPLTTA
jgi:hypothetical protein